MPTALIEPIIRKRVSVFLHPPPPSPSPYPPKKGDTLQPGGSIHKTVIYDLFFRRVHALALVYPVSNV